MLTERFDRFFKSDAEKLNEAEQIIALLQDSPELQERTRQRDEKRLAKIRQLLAEREEINRAQAETMPRLRAAVEEAEQKEKRAHEAVQAAVRERIDADLARLGASGDFSFRLSSVEAEIKKAAPREIDDFIFEMVGADEKARLELNVEHRPGPKARFTGEQKVRVVNSNHEAVEKTRVYIKAATAEAENMKLQAIPHDQLVARLAELKAGLPDTRRFESVEIPLPDVSELRRE
jgi:hypothetical protein